MSQANREVAEGRRLVSDPFWLDAWLVDPGSGQISRSGTVTRVEPKAMDVLAYLASHRGEVVSRNDLEQHVWRGAVVGYDAVTNTIIKLRKALGDDPHEPTYIETVPKRGYRLVAQIDSAVTVEDQSLAAPRRGAQPTRVRNRFVVTVALTLVAVIAIALFLFRNDATRGSAPSALVESPAAIEVGVGARPVVTVLPFEVLGADPEHLYLARGLTADLIADLSRLSGLFVVGAVPQEAAAGDDGAGAPQARYEVWGGVQRVGPSIKAEVRLIDADTRRQLWVERYDRPFSDFFEIQDAIGARLADALSVKVTEAEQQRRAHRYTRSVDAYDLFLQAQAQLLMRGKGENERARDLYQRAIALDPMFARAYGGLALTYAADYRNQWVENPDAALSRALDLAQTALQIDRAIPEVHWILGYVKVQQRQHREALAHLDQALALEPSYADALALKGGIQTYVGEPAQTIPLVRSAMRHNPGAGYLYFMVIGRAYFFIDDQVQALINLHEAVSRNPESLELHLYLAAALERSGDRAGAEWQAEEVRVISPDFSTKIWLETYPMTDVGQQERLISTLAGLGL